MPRSTLPPLYAPPPAKTPPERAPENPSKTPTRAIALLAVAGGRPVLFGALYRQTAGLAVGALVIERAGAGPLFPATAVGLPLLALWFVRELKQYRRVE